eukprot:2289809-Amphidinium_carterae.1
MRNYEVIKAMGWNEGVNWNKDPPPADMTILTQGTTMTPTMMLEGKWNTWSYADLMDPAAFYRMLVQDGYKSGKLEDSQKQYRWEHIVQPLCSSLGYQLMRTEEHSVFPSDGEKYYALISVGAIIS